MYINAYYIVYASILYIYTCILTYYGYIHVSVCGRDASAELAQCLRAPVVKGAGPFLLKPHPSNQTMIREPILSRI